MGNKGMLTARFNRKVAYVTDVIKASGETIEPLIPYVYSKPRKSHPLGNYCDTQRKSHRVVQLGNRWLEIPKSIWRWCDIEVAQWVKYADTLCKIVLSENGFVNYKAVNDFMALHNVKNLDDNILRQVVGWWSSSPSVIPNRKKVVKGSNQHNTIKHNHIHYGYEGTFKDTYRTRDILKMVADEL